MHIFTYFIYALAIALFLFLSGFAVFHAFRHAYLSARVKPITYIFVLVSVILAATSFYFLTQINF